MTQLYTFSQKRNRLVPALGAFALGAALAVTSSAAHAQGSSIKIEAEASTNTIAGTGLTVDMTLTPFSGTGYLNFNGNTPANSLKVTIPVTVTTGGAYNLVIRYESQYGTTQAGYGKVGAYSVNGGPLNQVYLNGTAPGIGTANFKSTSAIRIALNSGANSIVISDNGFGYFGVDYITLTPVAATTTALTPSAAGRVEAEAGQLNYLQSLVRDDDTSPYSGTGYVSTFSTTNPSPSAIVLPVTVATAGVYQVAVGARGQFGGKSFDTQVATTTSPGSKRTTALQLTDPVAGSPNPFASYVVGNYMMTAGTNTITLSSQTSYLDIDYVDITPTTNTVTAARASADAQKALAVYPNPTTGQALTVSLDLATAQSATVELVNALGQRVLSTTRNLKAGGNQFQLATDAVAAGVYQLVVRNGDQPALNRRVLITK